MQIVIDLPYPTSVNKMHSHSRGRVRRSQEYVDWIKQAGLHWMAQKAKNPLKSLPGEYGLLIILNPPDKRRRDLGNSEKVLSDLLQGLNIIKDDHLCQDLHIKWGTQEEAPFGARVILTQM